MKLPEFSPRAAADLDKILAFIPRDKPRAAENFLARLNDKYHLLAKSLGATTCCPACAYLLPGTTRCTTGRLMDESVWSEFSMLPAKLMPSLIESAAIHSKLTTSSPRAQGYCLFRHC
jgi:plasmid stabilization system protein ParE